jgi:hypothetical protein
MEKEKAICGMWHITQNELRANSPKMLSNLRNKLEPFVFNALEEGYGRELTEFWKTYTPPKKAKRAYMLVEGRIHPNMWFILRNMAWAGPDMSVYIFCSDQNYDYIMDLLGDKAPHFNVIVAFKGDPPKEQAIQEFINFYGNWKMWEMIDSEYSIILQMDNYFRKRLEDHLFCYDYYACRWAWKSHEPGGALAICRVAKMIEIFKTQRPNTEVDLTIPSDEFINKAIIENGTFPPLMENIENIMESLQVLTDSGIKKIIVDPYAVHQPWTFSYTFSQEEFKLFWRELLTIRI